MKRIEVRREFETMITDLPTKLQERIRSENQIEKLFDLLLEGNIFPVVQSLQEAQSRHEKTLFNERQRIVKEGKEKEAELIRRHSEEEKRCADRPQHLNILQTANKREFESFSKRLIDEQQRLDTKIVLDLDEKMLEQQTTLEKAGVPYMYATNKAQDVRLQMFIIEFILRIGQKISTNFGHE